MEMLKFKRFLSRNHKLLKADRSLKSLLGLRGAVLRVLMMGWKNIWIYVSEQSCVALYFKLAVKTGFSWRPGDLQSCMRANKESWIKDAG